MLDCLCALDVSDVSGATPDSARGTRAPPFSFVDSEPLNGSQPMAAGVLQAVLDGGNAQLHDVHADPLAAEFRGGV
ncbi:MAG: hypothetical protein KGR98_13250, partial [Verrucomicrobia bacterium]|nr:hypothetical protein [Verrucomicrobiota bacterium]